MQMSAVSIPKLMRPCWTLILTSLLAVGLVYGADTASDEQDIQSLESQVATSSELSDSLRNLLADKLSQARQRLGDFQTQAIELEVVQGEATTFNADVQRLQQQIQALTKPPPSEPPTLQDESELSAETAQRELSMQQLRHSLLETREHDTWLNSRASVIAQEIAAAAERFHLS